MHLQNTEDSGMQILESQSEKMAHVAVNQYTGCSNVCSYNEIAPTNLNMQYLEKSQRVRIFWKSSSAFCR